MSTPLLVVVGCPSIDTLIHGDQRRESVGGAAFLTALAARRVGASVGLVARVPPCLPGRAGAAFGPGGIDRSGLTTVEGSLPSFTIRYDDQHRAVYGDVRAGVEQELTPQDIPEDWLRSARLLHLGSLSGSASQQLAFLAGLRQRGFEGLVSAGTYRRMIEQEPDQVESLLFQTDYFFMNREEAALLVPEGIPSSHRGVVCVTCGSSGVEIWEGGSVQRHATVAVDVVDATGAGDAFCGGFLGALTLGEEPVSVGMTVAREALSGLGADPLLNAVAEAMRPRVSVDRSQVQKLAVALGQRGSTDALDFCGFPFPERDDPIALECLAAATLHQYGFWLSDAGGWTEPMYGMANGRRWKGSDYIWQAFTRAAASDPTAFEPARMAGEPGLFEQIHTDDDGACPVPDLESHSRLHQAYGASLAARFPGGFAEVLGAAEAAAARGEATGVGPALSALLATLPGYAEDPMAKKANLLIVMLARRPEEFLPLSACETVGPIVDYHVMRGCLRTGLIRVLDPDLRRRLAKRSWVDAEEEQAIRDAAFEAVELVVAESGQTVAEVDGFLFTNGRSTCLEVQPPRCEDCGVGGVCARAGDLFQPIFRTTAY